MTTANIADSIYRTFLPAGHSCRVGSRCQPAHPPFQAAPSVLPTIQEHAAIDPWYVARVHTGARDIQRTRIDLALRGFNTFFPRWVDHTRKGDIVRPYFVGYLFVSCPDGLWGEATRALGVVALLGNRETGYVARVPDVHMDKWRDRCGPNEIHDPVSIPQPVKRMAPGSTIKIEHGPMTGLFALVKLDEGARILALFSILGGERVMELPRSAVREVA